MFTKYMTSYSLLPISYHFELLWYRILISCYPHRFQVRMHYFVCISCPKVLPGHPPTQTERHFPTKSHARLSKNISVHVVHQQTNLQGCSCFWAINSAKLTLAPENRPRKVVSHPRAMILYMEKVLQHLGCKTPCTLVYLPYQLVLISKALFTNCVTAFMATFDNSSSSSKLAATAASSKSSL